MRSKILLSVSIIFLLFFPEVNFGQAPTLGTTSGFALFTSNGAFSNVGAATIVIGDVGNHAGANSAFPPGTLIGNTHWLDVVSIQAAIDLGVAYSNFSTGGTVLGTPLEIPGILTPGVYSTGGAAALNGNLTLNAGGNPNALFIICQVSQGY